MAGSTVERGSEEHTVTSDGKQPGRFSMLEATTGARPFVEVVDDLTRAGHDAVVDEMGLGALFLRADDCEKLLTDRRFGAVAMPVLAMSGVSEGPIYDLWSALMFGKDGDDHRRIRNVVAKSFTRTAVERYRDHIHSEATALAEALPEGAEFDLWESYSLPLAGRTACHIMDVPISDAPQIIEWALDVVTAFAPMAPETVARAESAARELTTYLDRHLGSGNGDGLLATITASSDVSYEEKRGLVGNLLFGGLDAMAKVITTGVHQLLEAGRWNEIDDGSVTTAVEELLRTLPPTGAVPRVAVAPSRYAGVDIEPGQMVLCSLVSASHDPRLFDRPDELDLHRQPGKPFAFGAGPHFCLGAHLARIVIGTGLTALATRAPGLTHDSAAGVRWGGSPFYGVEHLPLRC